MASFFDAELAEPLPRPEPRRERWRGDDTDTIGVPVPLVRLLARNERVAVIVGGVVAYPAGFSLTVTAFHRMLDVSAGHRHMGHAGAQGEAGALRFGLSFADGTKVTNMRSFLPPRVATAPTLQGRGGGGGGRKFSSAFWCRPLPPPGRLTLVCEWPAYGIAETREDVDAAMIIDAAARATAIWPDDVDLPDPPGAQPGQGGWSGYRSV